MTTCQGKYLVSHNKCSHAVSWLWCSLGCCLEQGRSKVMGNLTTEGEGEEWCGKGGMALYYKYSYVVLYMATLYYKRLRCTVYDYVVLYIQLHCTIYTATLYYIYSYVVLYIQLRCAIYTATLYYTWLRCIIYSYIVLYTATLYYTWLRCTIYGYVVLYTATLYYIYSYVVLYMQLTAKSSSVASVALDGGWLSESSCDRNSLTWRSSHWLVVSESANCSARVVYSRRKPCCACSRRSSSLRVQCCRRIRTSCCM